MQPVSQTVAGLALTLLSCGPVPEYPDAPASKSFQTLAIIGDTQSTVAPLESSGLQREQNPAEREAILDAIAERKPDGLVHLGDLVADGSSASQWHAFDGWVEPIRDLGIPFWVAVGNHDYWGENRLGRAHLRDRFPSLRDRTYSSERVGTLGLIMLDSNIDELSDEAWEEQRRWFEGTLEDFDQDSSVTFVVVCTHHPPFTNSSVTPDEAHVQEAFLGPFLRAQKTRLFASGHAHAYERFELSEKTLVVSGGGGGPRVSLLTGNEQRHRDLFVGPPVRPFHYLELSWDDTSLRVSARGLAKGQTTALELESFEQGL